jgi:hypothetical protein
VTNISILTHLHADLSAAVAADSGELSISGTYVETLEALAAAPRGYLCILEWLGEESVAEPNQAFLGIMRQELGIYLALNPGLTMRRGEALWLSESGRTLLHRAGAIRDRIREIRLEDDSQSTREFDYRGARQVLTPEGFPLRAYRLEFHIHNALPEPLYRDII